MKLLEFASADDLVKFLQLVRQNVYAAVEKKSAEKVRTATIRRDMINASTHRVR